MNMKTINIKNTDYLIIYIYEVSLGEGQANTEGTIGIDNSAAAKPNFDNKSRTSNKVLMRAQQLAKKQLSVTQDWQFDKEEFAFWEGETKTFTLYACCDNDGQNTLVPSNYNTPNNSFLKSDCTRHHVWMSPPFVNATPFLRHFETCRQMVPAYAITLAPDSRPMTNPPPETQRCARKEDMGHSQSSKKKGNDNCRSSDHELERSGCLMKLLRQHL